MPLRAIIGASQAFFNPAAYTLLSDIFPKKMIGSINGIFSGGVYLGGALASLSILLDGVIGWRDTLFVIGGIGVATALLCQFFVSEPRSLKDKKNGNIVDVNSPLAAATIKESSITLNEGNAADTIKQAFIGLKVVVESNEAKYLFAASVLRFCAGFSIAIWKAPFVFAKFPESATSFAGKFHHTEAISSIILLYLNHPHSM